MVEGVVFRFADDLMQGTFLMVITLEGVGVSDFITGGGSMTCLLKLNVNQFLTQERMCAECRGDKWKRP